MHPMSVAGERAQRAAGLEVPKLKRVVKRRRETCAAVRRARDGADLPGVSLEGANGRARPEIPELERGIGTARERGLPVGCERDVRHDVFVLAKGANATRGA